MDDKMTWQAAVVLMRDALDDAKLIIESVAQKGKNRAAKSNAHLCLQKIDVAIKAGDEVMP